jgi:hypothetical protein
MLPRPNTGSTAFDVNELLGTSRIGRGECVERDGRGRVGRPGVAAAEQKNDSEKGGTPVNFDDSCPEPHIDILANL